MSNYRMTFIPYGNITSNRCLEAEKRFGNLVGGADCLQVLGLTAFTAVVPGKPAIRPDGKVGQGPDQIIPGVMVFTEHTEGKGVSEPNNQT